MGDGAERVRRPAQRCLTTERKSLMRIEAFDAARHLEDLQRLVNLHLAAVIPGWALPAEYIERRLRRVPEERIVDPWVIERRTLCAIEGGAVVAAVHLHRYGGGPEVGNDYRSSGDIQWALSWPSRDAAAVALLGEARRCLREWNVPVERAYMRLPVPVLCGIADAWPHLAQALRRAGFQSTTEEYAQEAVWGGRLPGGGDSGPLGEGVSKVSAPPIEGLALVRRLTRWGDTAFCAVFGGGEIGYCAIRTDLTDGGQIAPLARWAMLADFDVDEARRNRGVGTWLLQQALEWMRLAGCDRIVFAVSEDEEGVRAGRLYRRFGWSALAHLEKEWLADVI